MTKNNFSSNNMRDSNLLNNLKNSNIQKRNLTPLKKDSKNAKGRSSSKVIYNISNSQSNINKFSVGRVFNASVNKNKEIDSKKRTQLSDKNLTSITGNNFNSSNKKKNN